MIDATDHKNTKYDPKAIEKKWQDKWETDQIFYSKLNSDKKKFYALIEFPYPSGDGLHVGHVRSNVAMDIISHKRRREGYEVLYPIGWDAFGLPAENYAIKTGIHPSIITKTNTDNFRRQLKAMGFSFDWSKEINTTDPKYYKWTQWIFLKFLEKGLAYKKKMAINWCPKDMIGLANEEVVDGKCERCGTLVEKRDKEQWMLAITKYADKLEKDLDETDFLEKIKIQQRNWIGRSEGALIDFKVKDSDKKISVFTTRPDTLAGVTYIVLAPENELINELLEKAKNKAEVKKYIEEAKTKSTIERTDIDKSKTGILIDGAFAINPLNNEIIPIWIADYVLGDYGTGAVMAVPAHDERDQAFSQKYNLPIKEIEVLNTLENKKQITEKVDGKWITTYKLRDWVFSRQRYWGEPIPVVHCEKCGIVPVPESDLPVELPQVENYKPTDNGESPLALIEEWVNTSCPKCNRKAKRETDTMPQWAGSSWYYLRYIDSKNDTAIGDEKVLEKWLPVDWYNGGMEHTTLHLLYSRFWHKFLYEIGIVKTKEPYKKRTSHGLILAEGGIKMSKSVGNVVNPDKIIEMFGADSLRLYEMFMGPFDQPIAWNEDNIVGVRRFLERIFELQESFEKDGEKNQNLDKALHKTIQKIGEDIEAMRFNTAVSHMMIYVNELEKSVKENTSKSKKLNSEYYESFLKILAPFAPHITEELWHRLGNTEYIHTTNWPSVDLKKIEGSTAKYAVQVNGKVRAVFEIDIDSSEDVVKTKAQNINDVKKWLDGKNIKKVIFIKGKMVSFVV